MAFALLLPLEGVPAHAQITEYRCETSVGFQNRYRRVFGTDIHAECDGGIHSAPFGNWGVDSNGGRRRNAFQFPGWTKQCTRIPVVGIPLPLHCNLLQWNSCTRDHTPTAYPHYYTGSGYTQVPRPDGSASHGGWTDLDYSGQTCASQGAVESFYGNHMKLLELDAAIFGFFGDGTDDLVTELTYPSARIPMTCDTEWDCYGSSGWLSPTGGADAVSADIRITVHQYRVICINPESDECF